MSDDNFDTSMYDELINLIGRERLKRIINTCKKQGILHSEVDCRQMREFIGLSFEGGVMIYPLTEKHPGNPDKNQQEILETYLRKFTEMVLIHLNRAIKEPNQ